VRTPTLLQMEALECGAAALGIVLRYYGYYASLEELRVACGVSRDGSKASNLVRAAHRYGLLSDGYRKEPQALREMPLPLVAFWNFNHFVVVEGFGRGRVHLNDPATGPRAVSEQEFDESFTGVVLTFEPGPEFCPRGQPPSLLRALQRRVAGSWGAVGYVVLAGLALVLPGLAVPVFSKVFVDRVLIGGFTDWTTLLWLGLPITAPLWLAMLGTAVVLLALTWLQQRYLLRLETSLALRTSSGFLWHVLQLPVEFFTQRSPGDVASRVAIADRIARILSGELATAALNVVLVIFFLAVMLAYSVPLAIIGVVAAAINFAFLRYVSRRRTDESQRLLQDRGKLIGTAVGGLRIIETLKATGSESDFFARFAGYQAKTVGAEQQLGVYSQLLNGVPILLTGLTTAAILGLGGLQIMDGALTVGTLLAFQMLMARFTEPITRFVALGGTLQEVEGDMNRLDDVLRYPIDSTLGAAAGAASPEASPERLQGALELRQVTFGYSRLAPPLLEDFSLRLEPGGRVALVGGSGSGKSTVAKLVAGLYEPWSGAILFDGRPRSELPRASLTSSVAMVDQDIFLFAGTVRDNLTLWDHTVPEGIVVQAARDAAIHADVAARAGGYDSRIEEGGANFSGGQRQRLEIARALVGSPRLLVLDEATSALDPHTEQLIDESLRRRGCTCLIVAHRLSTIRDCDEIIVLDKGKIVERGTHETLCLANGPYARLITME
jgi:NHLM bacteriocin system ABC transporter peptidase/ATP-binding protein